MGLLIGGMVVGLFCCGLISVAMSLVYFLGVRPKVRDIENRGPGLSSGFPGYPGFDPYRSAMYGPGSYTPEGYDQFGVPLGPGVPGGGRGGLVGDQYRPRGTGRSGIRAGGRRSTAGVRAWVGGPPPAYGPGRANRSHRHLPCPARGPSRPRRPLRRVGTHRPAPRASRRPLPPRCGTSQRAPRGRPHRGKARRCPCRRSPSHRSRRTTCRPAPARSSSRRHRRPKRRPSSRAAVARSGPAAAGSRRHPRRAPVWRGVQWARMAPAGLGAVGDLDAARCCSARRSARRTAGRAAVRRPAGAAGRAGVGRRGGRHAHRGAARRRRADAARFRRPRPPTTPTTTVPGPDRRVSSRGSDQPRCGVRGRRAAALRWPPSPGAPGGHVGVAE